MCTPTNPSVVNGTLIPAGGELGLLEIDFTNVTPGKYDLCIDWASGRQVVNNAVTVKVGLAGNLFARIEMPSSVRINRDSTAFLYYANTGTGFRHSRVKCCANAVVRLDSRYEFTRSLAVMGYAGTLPVNLLMPGEERRLAFGFKPTATVAALLLDQVDGSASAPFGWSAFEPLMPSLAVSPTLQSQWAQFKAKMGSDWGSVVRNLGALSKVATDPSDRTLADDLMYWEQLFESANGVNSRQIEVSKAQKPAADPRTMFACNGYDFIYAELFGIMPTGITYDAESDIKLYGAGLAEVFDPAKFDPSAPTFIIIHGNNDAQDELLTGLNEPVYVDLADEISKKVLKLYGKTPNIIRVDWSKPASGWNPWEKTLCLNSQGRNVIQEVGRDVDRIIRTKLQSVGQNLVLTNTVFVGHSFGNGVGYEAAGWMRIQNGDTTVRPKAIVFDPASRTSGIHIADYGKNFERTSSVALHTHSLFDEGKRLGLTKFDVTCDDTASAWLGAFKSHRYARDVWAPRAINNCWDPSKPADQIQDFASSCNQTMPTPDILGIGNSSNYTLTFVASFDPNDKLLWNNFVQPGDAVRFTIRFENYMTATAPAQDVLISDQLDPRFDWSTVRFEQVGFGKTTVPIVQDAQRKAMARVSVKDYRPEITATLDVSMTIFADVRTGQLLWHISSIDPQTGQPPSDPFAGFLPPNDSTGRGDGFVTFEVRIKKDISLGSKLSNAATIIFDTNDPINTPPVTIVVGPPSTRIYLPLVRR